MTEAKRIIKNVKFTHTKHNQVVTPSEFMNVAGFKIGVDPDQKKGAVRNTAAPKPETINAGGFTILIEEA